MNLKEELDVLAKELVDHCRGQNNPQSAEKDVSFADKLDTFKVLQAYYALQLKHQTPSDDESDDFNFAGGIGETDGGGIQRRRSS